MAFDSVPQAEDGELSSVAAEQWQSLGLVPADEHVPLRRSPLCEI